MKDFELARLGADPSPPPRLEGAVASYRLRELERRVGRIEAFLLGVLCAIALSVLGGLIALLNLPGP